MRSVRRIISSLVFRSRVFSTSCVLSSGINTPLLFRDSKFEQGTVILKIMDLRSFQDKEHADVLYMTPSNMTSLGDVMPMEKDSACYVMPYPITDLLSKMIIIMNFVISAKPRPCLQGLAGGTNVVYLSTFSKLLLPSIRLSFMILPDELLPLYQRKAALYNQTASKAEQLALCQFLRDGHLDSQIRKLKRLYAGKDMALATELEQTFGDQAFVTMGESVTLVHLHIKARSPISNSRGKAAKRHPSYSLLQKKRRSMPILLYPVVKYRPQIFMMPPSFCTILPFLQLMCLLIDIVGLELGIYNLLASV